LIVDKAVKTAWESRGYKHWTAGALLERDGKVLVILKKTWPYLWDLPAGHMAPGEEPEVAARREVKEETDLRLLDPTLIWQGEIYPDPCRRGVNIHEWSLYYGQAEGEVKVDKQEIREWRWVEKSEMAVLPFVRPVYYILDKIKWWEDEDIKKPRMVA